MTKGGSPLRTHPDNLQNMMMSRMNTIAATGAYFRSIACTLMFRAALRYFSDSDRRDVDKWDIPTTSRLDKLGKRAG